MQTALMNLKILLPFQIFAETTDVSRIVVETLSGSIGLLPHRLDCVAVVVPGIFIYQSAANGGENFVAVDEGILIKAGQNVLVSVRNAIGGKDLTQLHKIVVDEFLNLNQQDLKFRSVMKKMESSLIQHLVELHHE
jgi:F-type H+-transporting ATPase subunit epsilon